MIILEQSPLCLSPLLFMSKEKLESFFKKAFPGLEKYKVNYKQVQNILRITFLWKKKKIKIDLGKGGVNIFNKNISNFIKLRIQRQLLLDIKFH